MIQSGDGGQKRRRKNPSSNKTKGPLQKKTENLQVEKKTSGD